MKRLDITFHFTIKNELDVTPQTYHELANYILDMAWDDIYNCGLEPGNYEVNVIKEEW